MPAVSTASSPHQDIENFGSLSLPLGGKNKYKGVRKVRNDQYQGYTPKKRHTTNAFSTAHEAAVALALKQQNVQLDLDEEEERKPRASRKKLALEPLTERHAAPRLSYDASPATLSHGTYLPPAIVPAAPQRSAPVIAQCLTIEKAALMLMLGARQAMAVPLPA